MTISRFLPFGISIIGDEQATRDALRQLLDGLKPLDLGIEEVGTVELVLAEALNNIVEHAYPADMRPGPINIDCALKSDGLHFEIRDEGLAMPDGQIPLGMTQSTNVDVRDLPEGGFGWFLIRDLAKDVDYARVGACNILNLRIAVAI